MRKIAIIGLGHVGSTTAQLLIQRGLVDELILFDKNTEVAEAEVNDLLQGQIDTTLAVKLAANQLAELKNCQLIIMAAGDSSLLAGDVDRVEELRFTQQVIEEWAPKIKANGFSGSSLIITNPCDVITGYFQKLTQLPTEKIFGTGTSLDTARMKQTLAEKAGVHPTAINGYVFGEHGDTQFTQWSNLQIAGSLFAEKLSLAEITELETEFRRKASKVFLGKGYTSYGIANQAALIVEAIFSDSQKVMPVSVYNHKEKIYISQLARLGKNGIEEIYPLTLNEVETKKWQLSVARIKEMVTELQ
ncbi:lactate/malate family dehydrogenase [Enterococcus sp. LJL120]